MAKARFVSRCPNQKLWMIQPVKTVEQGVVVFKPGRGIQFINNEFVTSDPEEIEFIRRHRFYGKQIVEVTPGDVSDVPKQEPVVTRSSDDTRSNIDGDGKVRLECGYVDPVTGAKCDYFVERDTEEAARRSLNGHKTSRGHR